MNLPQPRTLLRTEHGPTLIILTVAWPGGTFETVAAHNRVILSRADATSEKSARANHETFRKMAIAGDFR